MNQIIFQGNVASNVDEGQMPSGSKVANFVVAVDESYTDSNQVRHERVVYYRVSVTNGQAAPCIQYLYKGRQVLVSGRLMFDKYGNPNTYTAKDGSTRTKFEVRAQGVDFGAHTKEYMQRTFGQPAAPVQDPVRQNGQVAPQQPVYEEPTEDDIPIPW